MVVSGGRPQLLRDAHRFLPEPNRPDLRFYECLLFPWAVHDEAVGILWAIKHRAGDRFDAEDARLLTSLARFAAAGHQMNAALDGGRRAQERSRADETRFRRVMDIDTVGFLAFRLDGGIIDANTTFRTDKRL